MERANLERTAPGHDAVARPSVPGIHIFPPTGIVVRTRCPRTAQPQDLRVDSAQPPPNDSNERCGS